MENILDIIEKYGLEGCIGIIICIIIYVFAKWIINKLSLNVTSGLEKVGEKLTDQISNQNDKLMDCMVEQQKHLIDYIITKEHTVIDNHTKMMNDRMALAEDINSKLKDIMQIHNSQRAFIIEFHNSNQNMSGIPFTKYSCTYEWFEKGLLPLGNKCVGLPFSSIAKVVQDVINSTNQQVIYTDMIRLEEENPALVSFVRDSRTKCIVYNGLHDKNNQLIGLLVLEYQEHINPKHINVNQLAIQAAELTSILNIRYKYSV